MRTDPLPRRQLERLVDAVAEGRAPAAVLEKMRALEASIAAKERELATLTLPSPSELEIARCKRAFRARLAQFKDLLLSDVPLARQALRKLLAGRIEFLPERRSGRPTYHLRWSLRLAPLV